jgi:hypothetical protein
VIIPRQGRNEWSELERGAAERSDPVQRETTLILIPSVLQRQMNGLHLDEPHSMIIRRSNIDPLTTGWQGCSHSTNENGHPRNRSNSSAMQSSKQHATPVSRVWSALPDITLREPA